MVRFEALVVCLLLGLPSVAWATNYLVVIADDLGPDKVAAYAGDFTGYSPSYLPATPTIDLLADAGLRFTRAWGNPVCSPARAALHTGEYAFRSGITNVVPASSAGVDPTAHDTLAERLTGVGYVAGAFGKWHLGDEGSLGNYTNSPGGYMDVAHPVRMGFDQYYGSIGGEVTEYDAWVRVASPPVSAGPFNTGAVVETTNAGQDVTDAAVAWIAAQTDPWLAVVAYNAPHTDDTRVYGRATFYDDTTATYDTSCIQTASLIDCVDGTTACTNESAQVYAALVECMDTHLADLLAGIDPAVLDDTLVIFTGDNGTPASVDESVFNVPNRGKSSIYEHGVRVPLIVADGQNYAEALAGDPLTTGELSVSLPATTTLGVHVLDVYATIYGHATMTSPAGVDSRTFQDCFSTTGASCGRASYPVTYTEYVPSGTYKAAVRKVIAGHNFKLTVVPGTSGGSSCLDDSLYDVTDALPAETTEYTGVSSVIARATLRSAWASIAPTWTAVTTWCP